MMHMATGLSLLISWNYSEMTYYFKVKNTPLHNYCYKTIVFFVADLSAILYAAPLLVAYKPPW